jgi:hypothetical protein
MPRVSECRQKAEKARRATAYTAAATQRFRGTATVASRGFGVGCRHGLQALGLEQALDVFASEESLRALLKSGGLGQWLKFAAANAVVKSGAGKASQFQGFLHRNRVFLLSVAHGFNCKR